jgi:tetratricopeptide (TPR) repeat protein
MPPDRVVLAPRIHQDVHGRQCRPWHAANRSFAQSSIDRRDEPLGTRQQITAPSVRRWCFLAALLAAAACAALGPTLANDFISYDDVLYITGNRDLQQGLSRAGLRWAWTAQVASWHPITWMSLLLDEETYGLNPAGYHLSSVLWHVGSTLLLFAALSRMTGQARLSAVVAALFAVHPLNVEPVAWATERKGVLSTFFWILAMWCYARYAERPRIAALVPVTACMALGLLSKPMPVTLPAALLLLDFWPLGRVTSSSLTCTGERPRGPSASSARSGGRSFIGLVAEKSPLFVLSAIFCAVAFVVEHEGGSLRPMEGLSFAHRLENAALSYLRYLGKLFWPQGLAIVYPYPPDATLAWAGPLAGLVLIVASAVVLWLAGRHPYLPVGWFWFLGTLVPVIGLIPISHHSMADRYAYVPEIGIFLMAVWGLAEVAASRGVPRAVPVGAALIAIGVLIAVTVQQVAYWHDSRVLWEHALDVTSGNYVAHASLGTVYDARGDSEAARAHYREAVEINPANPVAQHDLAGALAKQGRWSEAIHHYQIALSLEPDSARTHANLGITLMQVGRLEEAVAQLRTALQIEPEFAFAHNNLGLALALAGERSAALEQLSEAARLDGRYASGLGYLATGRALLDQGKSAEAVSYLEEAVRRNPSLGPAYRALGLALERQGRKQEASRAFRRAAELGQGTR